MSHPDPSPSPRRPFGIDSFLQTAFEHTGLTGIDLWLRYVALGGSMPPQDLLSQIARNGAGLDTYQRDVLALALNERFHELDMDTPVPYVRD